jgi:hypothetical protein
MIHFSKDVRVILSIGEAKLLKSSGCNNNYDDSNINVKNPPELFLFLEIPSPTLLSGAILIFLDTFYSMSLFS